MEEEGVVFQTCTDVGKNISPETLKKEFDRIVLACGASTRETSRLRDEYRNIYFAVDFLSSVTKSLLDSGLHGKPEISAEGKHVLVIGGGDTGNDCVGTAVRLGAKSVTQLEMMPEPPETRAETNPWPQWPRVKKDRLRAGGSDSGIWKGSRIYETTVKEFIGDEEGNVKKAVITKLIQKKDEKSGRMQMVPVPGSEKELKADLVLIAAGFLGSESYVTDAFQVAVDDRTNVSTEENGYETNVKHVFVAGDMRRGQSLVVWAICEGYRAARAVDFDLMGFSNL